MKVQLRDAVFTFVFNEDIRDELAYIIVDTDILWDMIGDCTMKMVSLCNSKYSEHIEVTVTTCCV